MMNSKSIYVWFLIFLFQLFSCDLKTPDDANEEKVKHLPFFLFEKIDIPDRMINLQDSMVQRVVNFIEIANSLNKYTIQLEIPVDSLESGPPWRYKFVDEKGLENDLLIIYNEDEMEYSWFLKKSGDDSISGNHYQNFLAIKAEMNIICDSLRRASIFVFDEETDQINVRANLKFSEFDGAVEYTIYPTNDYYKEFFIIFYSKNLFDIGLERDVSFQINGAVTYSIGTFKCCFYWYNDGTGFWRITDEWGDVVDSDNWE